MENQREFQSVARHPTNDLIHRHKHASLSNPIWLDHAECCLTANLLTNTTERTDELMHDDVDASHTFLTLQVFKAKLSETSLRSKRRRSESLNFEDASGPCQFASAGNRCCGMDVMSPPPDRASLRNEFSLMKLSILSMRRRARMVSGNGFRMNIGIYWINAVRKHVSWGSLRHFSASF